MNAIPLKKNFMETWEHILSQSIFSPEKLSLHLDIDLSGLGKVVEKYPMRINPYYLDVIRHAGSPVYRQAVPDKREIAAADGFIDPLDEESLSPVPGLTHKYPDRVLFLVSNQCAMYCRFCNRKRKVGRSSVVTPETIREGLEYIRSNRKIRDVLLSGGDPLLLKDGEIFKLLSQLRSIEHVDIIRIGTRVPCTLPHRITFDLVKILKSFHPLYINTHFNHPSEITEQAAAACTMLADGGISVGCQTVLLKGVNDSGEIMADLMKKLLSIRVKPYYLFQADLTRGTSHFWTPIEKGIQIMDELQGNISGLAVPRYVIDLPQGGGKIPVTPEYIKGIKGDRLIIRNYLNLEYSYPIIRNGHVE